MVALLDAIGRLIVLHAVVCPPNGSHSGEAWSCDQLDRAFWFRFTVPYSRPLPSIRPIGGERERESWKNKHVR
jgi:hypothetical protein